MGPGRHAFPRESRRRIPHFSHMPHPQFRWLYLVSRQMTAVEHVLLVEGIGENIAEALYG